MDKLNLAIIGHGFVGKAVDYGFDDEKTNKYIVDPVDGIDITELKDKEIDVSFVCVPTPMGEDGSINASIVTEVVDYLTENVSGLIVLKSTVTPDLVDKLASKTDRFVYNPEFLTERNANEDFVNPIMHVFGGNDEQCRLLERFYFLYSHCADCPVYYMAPAEASFVKYGINSFLATKVAWFNQYYKMIENFGANYDKVIAAIGNDDRVSASHTRVPGPDGKLWFGGACFTKDTNALVSLAKLTKDDLSILNDAVMKNAIGRSQYELDDREKEQNVQYKV